MNNKKYRHRYSKKRLSIALAPKTYNQIMALKQHTHTKSFNRVINILLIDELIHPNPLNSNNLIEVKKEIIKLNEEIGKLDIDMNNIGNNINQATHKINTLTFNNNQRVIKYLNNGNFSDFMSSRDAIIRYERYIKNNRNTLKNIDKEIDSLLQLLM